MMETPHLGFIVAAYAFAALTTIVLNLDTTAVLLTPVMLAAAVSPALAATTAPASTPRWHIAATYPVGSQIDSVSSDSSHDAWLAGMSATSGLLIRHWNGTKWVAASPAGVSSVGSAVIAASSARTAWAFADISGSSLALRRSGTGWVRYQFANGSSISAAAVFTTVQLPSRSMP